MEVSEGELVAGKYRIERVLGEGGMGVVVAARHLQLDERVAIKFMHREALANAEAVARFAREARAAVRIKSEHVARVSDVGTLDNGAPYMVMEYLDGVDLSAWITQRGVLPLEQAVEFVLQACEAIAEAHTLGIVHRDLKPANLFIIQRPDGALAVKVLDFGISRTTELVPSGGSMTRTAALMGSPLYMSPEQMQSAKNVDARSDIWALGVVLYELITGQPPFQGETMPEVVLKVATAQPIPLRVVRAEASPGLEAVVLKCLEKERKQRYQTIGEFAMALLEFAPRRAKVSVERISGLMQRAGMSASAMQLPPSSDPVDARSGIPDPQTMASWGQTAPPPMRRRRVVLSVSALIALPIFAVGTVAAVRSGMRKVPPTSSVAAPGSVSLVSQVRETPSSAPTTSGAPEPSTPVVEPSSATTGVAPAIGAASHVTAEPTPGASIKKAAPAPAPRPRSRVLPPLAAVAPAAVAPAAVAPAAVASAAAVPKPPTPTSAKNPLKMTIQ